MLGFIGLRSAAAWCWCRRVREGSMDFINIVPRIALGVIGSGYIAAVIPPEVITGWLGPDSGWFGVLTAVIAGAATPGGPVVGFSIGAVALKVGGGPPQVIAYVVAWALFAFQRHDLVGNPVHAGQVRLVSRRGVGAVSVPGGGDRDGDREAVRSDRHPRLPRRCIRDVGNFYRRGSWGTVKAASVGGVLHFMVRREAAPAAGG